MAYTIENVDWARDKHRLKAIREDVFVLEWRVPQDSEFDERDASAFHVLLLEDGEEANQPIATGRVNSVWRNWQDRSEARLPKHVCLSCAVCGFNRSRQSP